MNKLALSTMVAVLLMSASLHAQVKEQFQDRSNGSTTIIVKEDNANDMDILNEQFDLNDVGMHQVIRITTRKEVAPPPVQEEVPAEVVSEKPEETFAMNTVKTVKENKVEKEALTPTPVAAPAKTVTQKRKRSSSSSKHYKRKSNQHKFKVFNKRFKKQKRKRVPRKKKRKNRCYRF